MSNVRYFSLISFYYVGNSVIQKKITNKLKSENLNAQWLKKNYI